MRTERDPQGHAIALMHLTYFFSLLKSVFAAMVSASYHNEDSNLTLLTNDRDFRTPTSQEVGVLFFFVHESNMLTIIYLMNICKKKTGLIVIG